MITGKILNKDKRKNNENVF